MSDSPSFFTVYILPVLLGLLGSTPGLGALLTIILRNKSETKKTDSETLSKYEEVARNAAQNVLTKDTRIAALEATIDEFRKRFRDLEDQRDRQQEEIDDLRRDKSRLENEKQAQSHQICLLQERVLRLEQVLRDNDIPLPNGGGTVVN